MAVRYVPSRRASIIPVSGSFTTIQATVVGSPFSGFRGYIEIIFVARAPDSWRYEGMKEMLPLCSSSMIVERGGIFTEPLANSPKAFSTASIVSPMERSLLISSSDRSNIDITEKST